MKGQVRSCPFGGSDPLLKSVAAAGQKKDGNDDEPDAVVIKKIAKAVIHNYPPRKSFKSVFALR